jgi:ketosteroid isomerase-like protein
VSAPAGEVVQQEPRRFLLRPAGVLTQLCAAGCLLLGTIALVLVQQNKSGGMPLVILWSGGAMAGLVFGGLMSRGGMVSLFASAALDATFGIVLLVIDYPALRKLLRVLPESDVGMIADILVVAAVVMIVTAVLCLASIGQARRYAKAFDEAVAAAAASDPALAQAFSAQRTVPPVAVVYPGDSAPGAGPAAMPVTRPPAHIDEGPTDPMTPIIPTAASTNRGWTPAKATGRTTMMIIRPPAEETRSRRRIYIALGGFAIGVGAGMGVLVSSGAKKAGTANPGSSGSAVSTDPSTRGSSGSGSGGSHGSGSSAPGPGPGPVVVTTGSGSAGSVAPGSAGTGSALAVAPRPTVSVRTLLDAQREAIAKGDARALAATFATDAFAFGIDAGDVVEGRQAIEEMLVTHIGDAPPGGFTVETKFTSIGSEQNHAWTAEDLELTGSGVPARRIAITQLAMFIDGHWTVLALSWGTPVADATAERMAVLGTLPRAKIVPNRHDGGDELDKAVRAAFASRRAFADARSEREDAFNFGSGPNERIVGGVAIKRLFGRLKSDLKIDGGAARVVAGGVWDPAQKTAPYIGWAAINVAYTQKGQAATDITQVFRVLAVMLREGDTWKIVQTQFSNAGPIR